MLEYNLMKGRQADIKKVLRQRLEMDEFFTGFAVAGGPGNSREVAAGLAAIADPTSEEALIKAHKEDGEGAVKIQSAIALGNIGGQKGIAALIETIQDTGKGNNVRANSAKALGDVGSVEAKPVLEAALEENVAIIHFEAAEALRKITGESYGYER